MHRSGRRNNRINPIKRVLALVLVIAMAFMCLTACGDTSEQAQNVENAGTIVSETDTDITLIDQAGREVTVKKDPESIALCYRVVIRFLLCLDQGDKIKGIGKTEEFLEELQPSLKDCADVGKGVADIEAMAELNPDLFIHKASDVQTLEAVQKIGIPSVGIDVETPEEMTTALKILGIVCGADAKADQLIEYYDSQIDEAKQLTSDIKKKKTAIVMGSSIGKVADGTMLQGEMLECAGAVNCAADLEATELWPTAGAEQIMAWNPDYIFITNQESTNYSVDDIMNDPAWSEVKAVKDGHVFLMPSDKDSWELPGIASAVGIQYMIHTIYPELLSDEELVEKVNEFYKLAYGKEFDRNELGY